MEPKTGTIKSHDGLDLYYHIWEPASSPRGIIAFFHGGGGHSGQPTYNYFIKHFLEKGYALYGLDQRGHGRSGGDPFHINSMQDVRLDMQAFLAFIKQRNNGEAIFALGQSMGGLFVLDYCLHHPHDVAGAIAIASGLNLTGIPYVVRLIFRLLSRIVPKKVLKVRGVDLSGASRDPKQAELLTTDPLTNLSSTPKTVVEITNTVARVHENAAKFQTPLLMIHGTADPISPYTGSERFFNGVTMADKTLQLYPDGYHQPFIDTNREEVFADLEGWFEAHINPTRTIEPS
ncbi:MAG: lysophospholipase [Chloroflexota bacterium]